MSSASTSPRVEQGAGGVVERADVLLAAAGEVDRVRGRGGRGQAGAQLRRRSPGRGRAARGPPCARGRPRPRRGRRRRRGPRCAGPRGRPARSRPSARSIDLLRRAHALDPGGAAGGVDGGRVARQRAGVRADGARGRLGALDREQDDVLARARGRPARPPRTRGRRGSPRRRRRSARSRRARRGRGRGRRPRGRPGCRARRSARSRGRASAASSPSSSARLPLCETSADRARREVSGRELELRARVEDADAVRPEQDGAGGAHAGRERRVARAARIAVGLAGGDRDDRPGAGGERVVDRLLDRGGRDGEDDELRGVGELGERAVRGAAEDLAAAAVDEVHGAAGARRGSRRARASCPT